MDGDTIFTIAFHRRVGDTGYRERKQSQVTCSHDARRATLLSRGFSMTVDHMQKVQRHLFEHCSFLVREHEALDSSPRQALTGPEETKDLQIECRHASLLIPRSNGSRPTAITGASMPNRS